MVPSGRPEVLALLAECKDRPNDDTPRLILADFLEDSPLAADRARGQFIRLQCRLARMTRSDPERPAVQAGIRQLRAQYEVDWVEPLLVEDLITDWTWDRGLLAVEVEGRQLLNCRAPGMEDSEAIAWVETLHLDSKHQFEVLRPTLECPLARGVTVLDLSRTDLGVVLDELAQSEGLRRLRKLDLSATDIGWDGLRTLAGSEHLIGLEHLIINGIRTDEAGVGGLAHGSSLGRLETLEMSRNRLGPYGLVQLARSEMLPRLTVLRMENDQSDQDDVAGVDIDHPGMARFTRLYLGGNPGWEGVTQRFAASPHFARLTHLHLNGCGLNDENGMPLARSQGLRGLVELNLRDNHFSEPVEQALRKRFGAAVLLSMDSIPL